MDYKGLTSSELADTIGVQRSNVTHVLQGRNKPSFQFIEKLLQAYPELNAKWLLLGNGSMVDNPGKARTLFDQETEKSAVVPKQETTVREITQEPVSGPIPPPAPDIEKKEEKITHQNEFKDQFFSSEKAIERLVIFYKDQTFKVYNPSL